MSTYKASIKSNSIKVSLKNDYLSASISNKIILTNSVEVLDLIESGGAEQEEVKVISFTDDDLVNGQLIKLHGLNRRVVSVVVTDSDGLEFNARVNNLDDNTRVLIDLTRFGTIQNTWYATIR